MEPEQRIEAVSDPKWLLSKRSRLPGLTQRLTASMQTMTTLAQRSVEASLVMICAEDELLRQEDICILDRSFKKCVVFAVPISKTNKAELCQQPINVCLNGHEPESHTV
jgi:hypothetical protein